MSFTLAARVCEGCRGTPARLRRGGSSTRLSGISLRNRDGMAGAFSPKRIRLLTEVSVTFSIARVSPT